MIKEILANKLNLTELAVQFRIGLSQNNHKLLVAIALNCIANLYQEQNKYTENAYKDLLFKITTFIAKNSRLTESEILILLYDKHTYLDKKDWYDLVDLS